MKIIVLDFQTQSVDIFNYSLDFGDAEEYMYELEKNGSISKVSDCQWMVVDDLKLQIH
jgi:hypothetical protein